ncbi:MAG: ybaK 1 [Marmoricola sp.]|nr:ybaK 1 [Marmoricola sp.]
MPTTDEHPSITRFRAELAARGGTGRIVVLPDSVHTAALAAGALGCEVGAIANSLLFRVPTGASPGGADTADARAAGDPSGEPVLLLTSGEHRVDTARAAERIGVPHLRRADPDFVRRHTGQVIGGVSPFDHPTRLRTFLDPWLARHEVVWAAAGHPAAVFSTTYDELREMTAATVLDVT